MKVLFVGLGSIGQRHLRNLKLIYPDAEILAHRETKHNNVIENCGLKKTSSLEEYYNIKQFYDLDEALNQNPNIVFVTNPTSKHFDIAFKAVSQNAHVFVEKPLSHNLDNIELLQQEAAKKNIIVAIGYSMRFHPCYKFVSDFLKEKKMGKVLSASFEWGAYFPNFHKYEHYGETYLARSDLGGGVILNLIHEIDMIYSFFGYPKKIYAVGGKLSSLDIDVEDTTSVLMEYDVNQEKFPVSLFLSFAQTKETRCFKIQFDKATLFCDFMKNTIEIYDICGKLIEQKEYNNFERNQIFIDEIKSFFNVINGRQDNIVLLDEGIASLKFALEIKEKIGE